MGVAKAGELCRRVGPGPLCGLGGLLDREADERDLVDEGGGVEGVVGEGSAAGSDDGGEANERRGVRGGVGCGVIPVGVGVRGRGGVGVVSTVRRGGSFVLGGGRGLGGLSDGKTRRGGRRVRQQCVGGTWLPSPARRGGAPTTL